MSRHRNIRGLDVAQELDDFEYDDEEDYEEEEMTPQQKQQMREASKVVWADLKDDIPQLPEKELEDTLWHYYFDVRKTITYLRKQYGKPAKPKPKKQPPTKDSPMAFDRKIAERTLSTWHIGTLGGFFDDCPWGEVPEDRLATFTCLTEMHGPGGLLGGNPGAPGKVSKLAALAKQRRAAAEKQAGAEKSTKSASIALLSKLTPDQPKTPTSPESQFRSPAKSPVLARRELHLHRDTPKVEPGPEAVPISTPAQGSETATPQIEHIESQPDPTDKSGLGGISSIFLSTATFLAPPSTFASSLFGNSVETTPSSDNANNYAFYVAGAQSKIEKAFVGPSPDDIVKTAQASSQTRGFAGTGGGAKPSDIAENVQALSIKDEAAELERIAKTSKKLDVLKEYEKSKPKESANFVVIGHVDAGKSTLMGRILLDSGVVNERTVNRFKQEAEKMGKSSFALAWVLDETQEERARGVTMDIATNSFETAKTKFTILDAPGHKDFIPNMIAGAAQADFAVLVIDASTGAFESGFHLRGQTKEHTLLVRSIGVQQMVVAVNKLDSVDWSEARFREIEQQMLAFFNAAGFQSKNIYFVPCSGLTGENVVKKATAGLMPWYSGKTLIGQLEQLKPMSRAISKPLRLSVQDVFRGGIMNPVSISGRVDSGSLQVGDVIVALPSGEKAAIKLIEINENPVPWAVAGNTVTLHLAGIDMVHLKPGDIICNPDNRIPLVNIFNAKILAFETITPMSVDIHRGRLHVSGRIAALVASLDKSTGAVVKKKPRHIPPGGAASIRVELLNGALPLETGNRIIFRGGGDTVASGIVE